MALAFDATTGTTGNGSTSFSHTCTGPNLCLYLVVTGWWVDGTALITSVTYNGVALTSVANSGVSTGQDRVQIWRLVAPATGPNTIVITWSGGSANLLFQAISYSGVHQVTPDGSAAIATGGTGTNPSVSQATTAGDVVIDGVAEDSAANTATFTMNSSTGRTQVFNGTANGTGEIVGISRHDNPANPQTMGWTVTGTQAAWAEAAINIHPAPLDPAFSVNAPFNKLSRRPAPFKPGLPR
jgi:hypothetical protein